jgi:predicted 3-demethylubiquinone-9 3-methyltransferase (glyoxalase superfamily)
MHRQKVTTFLWFDSQAEEAAKFYVSLFKDSKITSATAMVVNFQLAGIEFIALNGGPHFKFTEAISLLVDCADQAEVDELWEKLSAGGSTGQCGWLKDKYGLSWQIVPRVLPELLSSKDVAKSQRVVAAMMQMTKLDVAALESASAG